MSAHSYLPTYLSVLTYLPTYLLPDCSVPYTYPLIPTVFSLLCLPTHTYLPTCLLDCSHYLPTYLFTYLPDCSPPPSRPPQCLPRSSPPSSPLLPRQDNATLPWLLPACFCISATAFRIGRGRAAFRSPSPSGGD